MLSHRLGASASDEGQGTTGAHHTQAFGRSREADSPWVRYERCKQIIAREAQNPSEYQRLIAALAKELGL